MEVWGVFERYGYSAEKVLRKTDTSVWVARPGYGEKGRRVGRLSLLVELASEKEARDLASRLSQSRAQQHQAEKQAREQHTARVAKLVAEAKAKDAQQERPPQAKG